MSGCATVGGLVPCHAGKSPSLLLAMAPLPWGRHPLLVPCLAIAAMNASMLSHAQAHSASISPTVLSPRLCGDPHCPLLIPHVPVAPQPWGRAAALGVHTDPIQAGQPSAYSHPPRAERGPSPGTHQRPPPYQRGCATVKRRCRRMLWFIMSFLKRMGELRGELRGDAAGEAPGERCVVGSMAQLRDPQHGGSSDGEATLPAGAEQEARGCPSRSPGGPGSPGKLSIPLPPAPGKLNNCLAPAAGTWNGSPTAALVRCAPGCPGMWPLAGPVPPATLLSPRQQLLLQGQGCSARTHSKMPC